MPGDSSRLHINSGGVSKNSFDAIVIGSGISGGWSAKELCGQGLKTLLLERGRNVVHLKDYPTTNMAPWEFAHRGKLPASVSRENPVVSRCYAFDEATSHFLSRTGSIPTFRKNQLTGSAVIRLEGNP